MSNVTLQHTAPDTLTAIPRFISLNAQVASAGQPSEQQLAKVAAAGFDVIINLGLHDDPSYALRDEAETVRALGMKYVHIPVQFSTPTLDDLTKFMDAMAEAEGTKVFVHCRHNKRVPVFLALDRVLRLGEAQELAFAAMRTAWSPDKTWQMFIEKALARHAA